MQSIWGKHGNGALLYPRYNPGHIGSLANSNDQLTFRVPLAFVNTEKLTCLDMQIFLRQPSSSHNIM